MKRTEKINNAVKKRIKHKDQISSEAQNNLEESYEVSSPGSVFIREKIKNRPINRKKLVRRTIITALMAVIFALVACITFLLMEPIFNNWLNPDEEPEKISFPEVEEETLPEDLLSEEDVEEEETTPIQQTVQVVENVELEVTDYQALYSKLYKVYQEALKSLVVVSGVSSDTNWFNTTQNNSDESSGLIIYNNEEQLYILTYIDNLEGADSIQVTFVDDSTAPAELIKSDPNTGICEVSVLVSDLDSSTLSKVSVATLGNSNLSSVLGTPILAAGQPLGMTDSVVYGMITSMNNVSNKSDANFKYLTTDINGSDEGTGFLFNYTGQVLGVITSEYMSEDMGNTLTAYSISDLKKTIERLSNNADMPYLGILGTDVTKEAYEQMNVPYGAYVTEVELDSPAHVAGIQSGDVIVQIGSHDITSVSELTEVLATYEPGATIRVKIERMNGAGYVPMTLDITLGQLY